MTRHDLQEAIVNLEYLLAHHYDASKTSQYEKQLQTFRRELQELSRPQCDSLTAAMKTNYVRRFHRWLQR